MGTQGTSLSRQQPISFNQKTTIFPVITSAILAICSMLSCMQATAQSGVPSTLAYSARLTNPAGTPVSGPLSIQFALYNVASGGTALWSETQSVTLVDGQLSVGLGEVNPLPELIFGQRLWLGIKIGTDAEMTPRPKLHAAPAAIKAKSTLQRTLHVPLAGTNAEAGERLRGAIAQITGQGGQWAIELDAGTYELGSSGITLPPSVALHGKGINATTITSSGPATLTLGNNSTVKNLLVSNTNNGSNDLTNLGCCRAINVPPGAAGRISDTYALSESPGGTMGRRIALQVAGSFSVLNDVTAEVRNGSNAVALLVADNSGPNPPAVVGVTLRDISTVAVGSAATRAIGAEFFNVEVDVQGSRFLADSSTLANTGAQFSRTNALLSDTQFLAFGRSLSGHAQALSIDATDGGFIEARNIQMKAANGAMATGLRLASNNSGGRAQFNDPLIIVDTAPDLRGVYSEGMAFDLRHGAVFVNGDATVTSAVGIRSVPPTSGTAQQAIGLNGTRVQVFHGAATDAGACIDTVASNVEVRQAVLACTNDGIEAGQSGNATNPSGQILVFNSTINSGTSARSIRKHQNWNLVAFGNFLQRAVLTETGGAVECLATTTRSPSTTFLPTGCPTP